MNCIYDHVRIKPDGQIGPHSQTSFELSYIITGSDTRTLGRDSQPFGSGEEVLVPPGMRHGWQFDENDTDRGGCIENITFHFKPALAEGLAQMFPELNEPLMRLLSTNEALLYKGAQREKIARLLLEMEDLEGFERARAVLSLLEALAPEETTARLCARGPTGIQKRLEKVRIYVACNYMRKLHLDDVAAYIGMNRSAFCTFFRKETGLTFIAYLNEYRVQKAREMLCGDDAPPVCEVAAACGFESAAHFSRTFKAITGVTPKLVAGECGLTACRTLRR